MTEREKEVLRIRSEIESNLRNCVRSFKIAAKSGIDPTAIMQDFMQSGSCFSFMLKEVKTIKVGFSSAITFEVNYSLGRYTLKNMLINAEEKVIELNKMLIRPEMSSLLKAFIVHNYLLDTVEYDYNSSVNPLRFCYAHSAYGALIEKKSVCQGIADAFKMIMDKAGEECLSIYGEARDKPTSSWEGHAWNIFLVRKGYYTHIDTTFDIGVKEVDRYMYFAKNNAQMQSDHRWKEELYPEAVSRIDAKGELEKELTLNFRMLRNSGVPEKYMSI